MNTLFSKLASIADIYHAAEHVSVGSDSLTWRAYQSFAENLRLQFARILASGITVRQTAKDPGADSGALFRDIENGYLTVFSGADLPDTHALAADSGIEIIGDSGELETASLNTVFRVCHDYFGHYASGARNTFSARGETAAFLVHAAMFPAVALPALACETVAQVAWFYAGAHVRRADGTLPSPADSDFLPLPVRPFAPQKNSIGAGAYAAVLLLNRRPFGANITERSAYDKAANRRFSVLAI